MVFASLPFAYYILYEWRRGTTPGKKAMRIRVLTDYGAPIGLRESATRNIVRVVDFLPVLLRARRDRRDLLEPQPAAG